MKRATQSADETAIWILVPLLIAIFLAPLLFGGTTETGVLVLDCLCLLSFALWAGRMIWNRSVPVIARGVWIPLALLLLEGAVHVALPHYSFDAASWSLTPVGSAVPWLPGTVDRSLSADSFRHCVAIAAAFVVMVSACRHRRIRWWVIRTTALSGLTIALVGIGQKAGAAGHMLWAAPGESGSLFFGAFRYHGNAAAFLNLCWPASFALWLRHCQTPKGEVGKSFWLVAFVVTLLAVFVNSSKAGHVIALMFLVVAVVRFWKHLPLTGRGWAVPTFSILVFLLFAGVAIGPGVATSFEKWNEVVADGSTWKGRLTAYQVCAQMLPDAGVWGSGPGTFRVVFPFYTGETGENFTGFWYHAHQDYLQLWIEWGAFGFLLMGMILIRGSILAFRKIQQSRRRRRLEISTSCALIAFGSAAVHALVDFPFQIPAIQLPAIAFLAFFWARREVRPPAHHAYTNDARMEHAGVIRERRDLESV